MGKYQEVVDIIASVLEVPSTEIAEDSAVGTVENWDSIHQLMIISTLESELGIQFSEDELFELTDVKSIVAAVEKHSL